MGAAICGARKTIANISAPRERTDPSVCVRFEMVNLVLTRIQRLRLQAPDSADSCVPAGRTPANRGRRRARGYVHRRRQANGHRRGRSVACQPAAYARGTLHIDGSAHERRLLIPRSGARAGTLPAAGSTLHPRRRALAPLPRLPQGLPPQARFRVRCVRRDSARGFPRLRSRS